jgi:hypothetical protein
LVVNAPKRFEVLGLFPFAFEQEVGLADGVGFRLAFLVLAISKSSREVFCTPISCSSSRLMSCCPFIRPTGAASGRMASLRAPTLKSLGDDQPLLARA